jgi:hypothetical protein
MPNMEPLAGEQLIGYRLEKHRASHSLYGHQQPDSSTRRHFILMKAAQRDIAFGLIDVWAEPIISLFVEESSLQYI